MATINSIVETAIQVADLPRSVAFYSTVLGFEVQAGDARFCSFNVAPGQVFLLFRKGDSKGVQIPGGFIPGHEASGSQHFAFGIAAAEFEPWRERLVKAGVSIESTVDWPEGGRSLYFRDPDGHLVELLTPGVWPNY